MKKTLMGMDQIVNAYYSFALTILFYIPANIFLQTLPATWLPASDMMKINVLPCCVRRVLVNKAGFRYASLAITMICYHVCQWLHGQM